MFRKTGVYMSGTRKNRSGKNTSSSRKTTAKKNSDKKQVTNQGNGIGDEVRLVVLLVVAVFLFVSNFGVGGRVGSALSSFMFGCIGLFAYVFPVMVLMLVLFSLANRENLIATIKVIAVILGGIALSSLLHMITMARADISGWKEIYLYCAEHKIGGGLLGGLITELLQDAFGTAGTYLILGGVLIICIVIITGKSFVRGMSRGSRKVYDSAVQDMERRREEADIRREQKKERRMERRVGVTPDVKIPKPADAGLKELTFDSGQEPEKEAVPSVAQLPGEKEMERAFTFPVHEPEAMKKEEPESFMDEASECKAGGLKEIGFSEEDLLKNALSRREFEKEKTREKEQGRTAPENKPVQTQSEAEISIRRDEDREYQYPPLSLLSEPKRKTGKGNAASKLQETAGHLQQIMNDFGVNATVTDASQGPAVTRFEVQPAHGVKVSKILALSDDIKLNLAVPDVRIEAPIPGKAAVGIEVPNKENSTVPLRELLESGEFQKHPSRIAFAVGKDIGGNIMVTDIAKMPHLLIAGATGSGKSVCINTLIMSILYKARPDEVKLIMIDPKVVELSAYNGVPHLLIPVVTDPKKAAGALNWAVQEMMGRYNKFAEVNVRNIEGYNSKVASLAEIEDDKKPEKMCQIVIIVDELADLMMVAPGEVEDAICRLAQLARAAGIHLIIATQRPSVNVITGLIKANMPSRIAFAVSSGVDSRTILDMNGAEKLLGKGDMLFSPYGLPKPLRVQGAFVSDAEVAAVVEFLSEQNKASGEQAAVISEQMQKMQAAVESASSSGEAGGGSDRDVLFADAGRFIIEKDKASIGMLQRWFKIGFNRAARIMDQLAEAGVVGEEEGTKPRKVLMSMEEFDQYVDEYV